MAAVPPPKGGKLTVGWHAAPTRCTKETTTSAKPALVRAVFNAAQRAALVDQVAGSLGGGVRSPVLERAFDYWKSVDPDVGQCIEEMVRAGVAPRPAEGMGEG